MVHDKIIDDNMVQRENDAKQEELKTCELDQSKITIRLQHEDIVAQIL